MKYLFIVSFLFLISYVQSQVGIVRGKVVSASSNVGLPLVKIQLLDQQIGAISSEDGSYEIKGIAPGVYSFKASSPGFKDQIINEITVTNARSIDLDFFLEVIVIEQKEVTIRANRFQRNVESPLSLKSLNATEIERLPGANRDVSKVIAALPGVASRATFEGARQEKISFI